LQQEVRPLKKTADYILNKMMAKYWIDEGNNMGQKVHKIFGKKMAYIRTIALEKSRIL
jgi:hypothetical protein